jgi:flagellin-like protein
MMGQKGISPVVAVVLLIAIAVIAAIGVWYWVGAFTGKPPTGPQQQVALSIESCNGSHVTIRNIGGITASAAADIYNTTSGTNIGFIEMNGSGPQNSSLSPGAISTVRMCNASNVCPTQKISGTFDIIDADYPSYSFSC